MIDAVFSIARKSLGIKTLTVDDIPNCSISDRIILELITDDDVNLVQLSEMIEENPSLVTLIISLANSAYFSSPNPIHNINDAIIKVLGMRMVKSIVLSVVLGRSLDISRCPNFSVVDYWTNCLSAGRFCQRLVHQSDLKLHVSSDQIYLSALLAGFGELVLIHHYPEEMNELIVACEFDLQLYVDSQKELFGISQSEAGVLIGRRWALPEMVITTMHHCFDATYQGENWQVSRVVGEVLLHLNKVQRGETQLLFSEGCEAALNLPSIECGLTELIDLRADLMTIAKHLTTAV